MAAGKKPKLDLSRVGTTGLPVWAGRVYDEILVDLQGEKGRRILREMSEQDPIIGGVLLGVEMLSRQVTWTMKPADETDKAQEVADFVDGALTDISPSWGDTLSEILSMLTYGWSWLEILYKRREGLKEDGTKSSRFTDGKIGWGGFAIRSQETLYEWVYENPNGTGELIGMRQMAPPTYEILEIPRNKSLHFKTRSRRQNPEGISFLRNCYRPWYMKKAIEQIEGIGIERDLAGLPVLWAPENLFSADASDEEKALFEQLKKIVTGIRRDEQEGVMMPLSYDEEGKNPSYKLELLSTGGERQFDTNAIINRYDERIAMSMLADFILMGHQAVGSFALSTTKTGLFSTALSAILDVIAAEVNLQAIPRLVLLNGYPLDMCPTLQHGNIESADMAKLGAFLKQLADAGMAVFPNAALEKYLLEQSGLPADPGAGELPLPVLGPDGQPLPPVPPLLPSGQPPAPAPARPAPAPAARPAAPAQRAASEAKRFVPLGTRVTRLAPILAAELEPEAYSELLIAVAAAGKFRSLAAEYQEIILQAEATEAANAAVEV